MNNNQLLLNELKSINAQLDGLEQHVATKEDIKKEREHTKEIVKEEIDIGTEKTRKHITTERFDLLNRLVAIEDRLKDVEKSNKRVEEEQINLAVAQQKQERNMNTRLDTQSHQLEQQAKQLDEQGRKIDHLTQKTDQLAQKSLPRDERKR
jgi:hypothetical protein